MISTDDNIKMLLLNVSDAFFSILPSTMVPDVKEDLYIAGGAIVSLVLDESPHDYDFFIKTGRTAKLLRNFFMEFPEGAKYRVKAVTQNAITIELVTHLDATADIQIVTRFLGPPERVFTSFDYSHCKTYFDLSSHDLVYDADLILNKRLRYTGEDNYPVTALKRLVKFVRRGWMPDNDCIKNLAITLSKLDLDHPTVHREQFTGFYGSQM